MIYHILCLLYSPITDIHTVWFLPPLFCRWLFCDRLFCSCVAYLTRLLAPKFHIVSVLPIIAVSIICPSLAPIVFVLAGLFPGLERTYLTCLEDQD